MLGDLSVSKAVAVQAWEYLNAAPSTHIKKLGMMACACNLSAAETETEGSQKLTGQWTYSNPGAPYPTERPWN